jgi:hypothetical protein
MTTTVTELFLGWISCKVKPTSADLKDGEILKSIMNHVRIGDPVTSMAIGAVGISACYAQSGDFGFTLNPQWQDAGHNLLVYTFTLSDSDRSSRSRRPGR